VEFTEDILVLIHRTQLSEPNLLQGVNMASKHAKTIVYGNKWNAFTLTRKRDKR